MAAAPADLVLDRVGERLRSLPPTPSQILSSAFSGCLINY
ncbi:hypothetical protein CICLE_v10005001mg, partial [Citrus x clementina]